ncbi:MAG: TonB-dependent receptor [Alistipes sp.]|nr:TonB-dependent receptor [Alistipes sp.]
MKIKHIFLFFVACMLLGAVQAQDLQGRILDSEGEPLIGAAVYWDGTTVGSSTDVEGNFRIHRVKGYDRLIASYLGYRNDTLHIVKNDPIEVRLQSDGLELESVVVEGTQSGNYVKRDGLMKNEMISFAGLCKMACCNLAESFENSASVTVGYSDAISGARQIKMLGLAGTYTQILDENRPIMRGLSAPYGLSYTPGMWLSSIQVSKGVSSVAAGHEAVTGQINLEHRKPTDEERLFVNLYLDDELRPEINLSSAFPLTPDKKLSTIILFHGSADTDVREMDHNHDLFRDQPETNLLSLSNRWLYQADNGMQLRWGFKLLQENRLGGMMDYEDSETQREKMHTEWNWQAENHAMPSYGSHIRNREAGGYFKMGVPVGAAVYDEDEQEEKRSSFAVTLDFDHYNESAYFGLNDYAGNENMLSANIAYNHHFTSRSSVVVGLQGFHTSVNERLMNATPWIETSPLRAYLLDREEQEIGTYAEYTYAVKDKVSIVAGLRGDYNAFYDRFFATPRGHLRWNLARLTTLRLSAGLGYRSTNIITDNIGILTTGRTILFNGGAMPSNWFEAFDRMEKAVTLGGSLTHTFSLAGFENATLSFDYFRTAFSHAVVVDQEWNPACINIYTSQDKAYTDTYQVDFSWTPAEGLDLFATYRYTDSEMMIQRADGSKATVERPLVNRYKALINVQYATRFRRWVFDATAQLNGAARIPTQTGDLADDSYSPSYPMFYAQVTRKVGKFDLYLGCENIADYRQQTPIVSAENPYSTSFNSMNIWGPLMGRKFYFGLRFNLY